MAGSGVSSLSQDPGRMQVGEGKNLTKISPLGRV